MGMILSASCPRAASCSSPCCSRRHDLVRPPHRAHGTTIRHDLVDAWAVRRREGAGACRRLPRRRRHRGVVAAWLADTSPSGSTLSRGARAAAGVFLFISVRRGPTTGCSGRGLLRRGARASSRSTAHGSTSAPGWLTDRRSRRAHGAADGLARRGRRRGAALVLGPALPGAGAEPLWDLDTGSGGGTRVTLSPLVDIRGRLVDTASVEVFPVASDQPAYWRMTALDTFDGRSGARGPFPARGRSPTDRGAHDHGRDGPRHVHHHRPRLDVAAGRLRPEPASPTDATSGSTPSRPPSSPRESAEGLTYEVTSVLPRLQPAQLAESGARHPAPNRRPLPGAAPRLSRRTCATTPCRSLRALERLRAGAGPAELLPRRTSSTTITVARRTRRGRHRAASSTPGPATASSSPARSPRWPGRSGFPPGSRSASRPASSTDGEYVVRGKHAHAWPEVYFEGTVGALRADSRPGRARRPSYTFVEPQQSTGVTAVLVSDHRGARRSVGSTSLPTGRTLAGLIPGELGVNVEAVGSRTRVSRCGRGGC